MSEYTNIKNVIGITKYIRKRLLERSISDNTLECVKVASYVYVFYAVNNKLYKETIKASVIYSIKLTDIETVIDNIITTIEAH